MSERSQLWLTVASVAVIAAVMLLIALAKLPYGYYKLLRWVTCAAAVVVALSAHAWGKTWVAVPFGLIALLFNPLIPIHLSREIWRPIDIGAAALFLVSTVIVRPRRSAEPPPDRPS